jgi:peptide deformylase
MALLPILTLPDPILRDVAARVERVDGEVRRLADDMLATMYDAPGIGLAAPQVGISRRLIVLDVSDDDGAARPLVMINPEILHLGDGRRSYEEGCLSIPDVKVEIERPSTLTVAYLDRDGVRQQLDADGLLATAIQHEIDHLDGRLIIDFLSRLKRDIMEGEYGCCASFSWGRRTSRCRRSPRSWRPATTWWPSTPSRPGRLAVAWTCGNRLSTPSPRRPRSRS